MRVLLSLLICLAHLWGSDCTNGPKPCYREAGVVNSADFLMELAPNAIASIFGTGLSYQTHGITQGEVHGGILPTDIGNTGVHVLVGSIPAGMIYVSALQINFIIPSILLPGPTDIQVVLDGNAGPDI